jgi:hypothetical protein
MEANPRGWKTLWLPAPHRRLLAWIRGSDAFFRIRLGPFLRCVTAVIHRMLAGWEVSQCRERIVMLLVSQDVRFYSHVICPVSHFSPWILVGLPTGVCGF